MLIREKIDVCLLIFIFALIHSDKGREYEDSSYKGHLLILFSLGFKTFISQKELVF